MTKRPYVTEPTENSNQSLAETLKRLAVLVSENGISELMVEENGVTVTLKAAADEVAARLCRLFLRGADGRRPSQPDNAWPGEDGLQFHEFFHGDTGRGLGASHQTGWTALVALLLQKPS